MSKSKAPESRRTEGSTHYDILEVSPRARPEVISAAYRALCKIYHPDKSGDDGHDIRRLNEAHDILSDRDKRSDYDAKRGDEPGEGKIIGGTYRILEKIAKGGFGITYRGEHLLTGMPVCIKHCSNVSPLKEKIFIKEARAVWDLRHYSLPTMRDLIRLPNGSLALVMSFIPGLTLEQVVQKKAEENGKGRIDPEHVAWITERVLNALLYMHFQGVVHGDIKPQNIIIQPETHAVSLVDFGLSLVKPDKTDGSLGHTPLFAPPEQEDGRVLLPQSDFYSLGMTMIYALSGGLEYVERKEVPDSVPDAMCQFIRQLIVRDILSRPTLEDNLFEAFKKVRAKAFGRSRSGMKPLL